MLVLWYGDAREFADGRPTYSTTLQRLVELRQELERFRYAQPLGRPAGPITEEPFHVFGKCAKAQHDMCSGSKREEECFPLLPIETRAILGEFEQLFVRKLPIERRLACGQWLKRWLVRRRGFAGHLGSLSRPISSSVFAFRESIATPVGARGIVSTDARG
jgi:hypothetical protein